MIEKYVKKFNDVFKINIKDNDINNKLKLLEDIFMALEDKLYSETIDYNEIKKKYFDISKKLEETFTEQQKELFEKVWELNICMNIETEKQLFIFGYLLANELNN